MMKGFVKRGMRAALLGAVFAAGYLCATVTQPTAEAQVGDLMKKAGESGGTLGSVSELGTTITDMKASLDKLNKNVSTLESIKKALGG